MRFTRRRRRSDRPDSARTRLGSSLETLETRLLLTNSRVGPINGPFAVYTPKDLSVTNPITNRAVAYSADHQLAHNAPPTSELLGNQGKIVSGTDRAGDQWTITVHGPGEVIVTDISPNDGKLDDFIDTIQLIGTNPNTTYVTGNVITSNRVQTSSTIPFNELIDTSGVKSIALNGFDLAETVIPAAGTPNNLSTGIFLTGGVQYLSFHNIDAPIDSASGDQAINVVIGDPSTPLTVKPTIVIASVNNTVFDPTATTPPALTPQTTPTVNIIVNGQIGTISMLSATSDIFDVLTSEGVATNGTSAQAFLFPTIATTGRTSIQATGINTLTVYGGATNLTASRSSVPFQNGFSGLNHLNTAVFNGPTDAVGLDVNGPIGHLIYNAGISNSKNVFNGTTASGSQVPAAGYGVPTDQTSYAGAGYLGGQVTATTIKAITIKASEVVTQNPSNPNFDQIDGPRSDTIKSSPGAAAINAAIAVSGNIGKTRVIGNLVNSEIKTGFDYNSAAAGLEGTRAKSKQAVRVTGALTNSVVSATVRPFEGVYNTPLDAVGNGKITGSVGGSVNNLQGLTALGNIGSGVLAFKKVGNLPPNVTAGKQTLGG